MSSHSRVRRPVQDAADPSFSLRRAVPEHGASLPGLAHAGHDFRRISIFPKTAPIQRKGGGDSEGFADVPEAGGGGEAIPDSIRAAMERSFAQDFSDVRVHTGPEAKQVGALAYTRGTDIHFQPGRYDPFGDTGRSLLGHELTHVAQQRAGRVASPAQSKAEGTAPINADTALEAEADTQGARAARGERAHVSGTGTGAQRKAEDTPIQREEEDDDPARIIDLNAPKRPNEFLPNRVVTPPTNNAPERSRRRPNVNADVGRGQTFTNRMAGEMTTHRNMLANNDTLPMDINATQPTIPNPKGFESFQVQQRSEQERELDALRNGKTNATATVTPRLDDLSPKSGEFTSEPTGLNGVRPRSWKGLSDHFPVTQGTTEGTTPLMGDVNNDSISTLSGGGLGALEQKLNNPSQSPTLRDNRGNLNYPRKGMVDRQESIMETAKNSDQHMRDLELNNTLPTHVPKNNRTDRGGWLYNGDQVDPGTYTLNNSANKPYHAIGTDFFDQRRSINNGGVEKLLPQMPHWNNALANDGNRSNESRLNVWSEADVNPVKTTNDGNAWDNRSRRNRNWANLENRDEERLLHTHPNSQIQTPNGQGGMSTGPVDNRFYVTNDHYKSAVPVSPLQENYKRDNPYQSPYGSALLSDGVSGPTRSSLTVQSGQGLDRMIGDNLEIAKQSSKRREELEEQRTQEDLKRLAPSDSVRSMYDMGKRESEQWTLKNLERQHLGVQEFVKSGVNNAPTNDPAPPMSEDVQSMYNSMYL